MEEEIIKYKNFIYNLANQAYDIMPVDIIEEEKKSYVVDRIIENMEMACPVLADDKKYNFDEENVKYTAQIIAEWTFHKCIDMFRSNIPKELWDDLILKVASVIFEVVTKGIKEGIKSELILESVEQNINIAWEKRIKELYKNKAISTKCMLDAMRNSSIDRFSTAKQLEDCYNAAPKSDKEK